MSCQRSIGDWLIYCANPAEAPTPAALPNAGAEQELLRQSDQHGILPLFLRRFPFTRAASRTLRQDGRDRHRGNRVITALLQYHGRAVMADAAGLPVAIVKGPVFAQSTYPEPALRGYTDIDILAAPAAVPRLAGILEAHGFTPAEFGGDNARGEWKWLHRVNPGIMIEIQTDLVHAPAMRKAVSLRYEDIADGPARPAALLFVALVHAGAVHQYERLQLVTDICLAARKLNETEEERRLELMIKRTGARLTAVTGLDLAARLFRDGRCREIANAFRPARFCGLARLLLSRATITSTMSEQRALYSWRRQIVRELMKRGRTTD